MQLITFYAHLYIFLFPQEEAYLREAIKASLEEQKQNQGKSPERPKISAEAADLLIDFMDDWDATR